MDQTQIETKRTVPWSRRGLAMTVADSSVLVGRNMRHFVRQPQLLIFSTIQPVMFVLLFAYVFGGAIGRSLPSGITYIDFLLPGILIQSVAFRASQTAVGLAEDLNRGVIDRFRSMPMSRAAVLIGRTLADLARSVLILLLMTAIGYIIGFRFREGVLDAAGAICIVSLFGFALSWIFVFVGLVVRGAEAAQSAGFVVIFPLVFASSVFVPLATMPVWLQSFAKVSPVSVSANAARALAIGGQSAGPVLHALLWIAGLLVVFIPLSAWQYRKMT
jgi:ABC transporter DrrB family efflux protein